MASEKSTWHEMTEEALESQLATLEADGQKMKFEQAIRGIADNSQFKKMRQETARILTELRKREIAEYTPEDLEGRSRIRARRARLKK
jgi:large subunit ribosomal protein L29